MPLSIFYFQGLYSSNDLKGELIMNTATHRFLTALEVSRDYFEGTISYKKILQLTKENKLPAIRSGKRYVYSIAELEQWSKINFATPAHAAIKNIR